VNISAVPEEIALAGRKAILTRQVPPLHAGRQQLHAYKQKYTTAACPITTELCINASMFQ